ncbi:MULTISPECIES: rhodanese-like domain-containing protein [unclassified Rhodococcus (in: high G+C Gram-positive bacteria)]|jgi:rhodanese-related sulfurtransferase|uniref:rhodanese-like domain-containing protein n=1 Tax=unclassified Rhodococcus (in: high G+C Gram-positive bacteria) TaxID=192944 RepID=UPI0007BC60DE|nr:MULTISPECIES: rhodanese-like domain-containing protein [unclassified Rhodococcus (in: high G+C Gram-positive bacteria)]KZE99728.1 sulfurtransferase [Rhodococcus sp. EPR-147]KZF00629.1 sulfurtransferase [Rhodococcus sp. EPR-279]MDV7989295.1 rhodanese-like domain-containing protein [Rhodococcus sp. IEGM 1374]OZE28967.1 sulfurtransferase [Rhodococcus sp. 05-2254-6]OZE33381.1 sulfurtransferase [Rhodococcus sp. 05-2254-4]
MTIVEMLESARETIDRMTVFELRDAVARGAVVVDIRPQAQRAVEGTLPGALAIERNVLEWRLDPTSDARLAIAVDHDVEWVVICSEGYTSSLAAASLKLLGLHKATDLVGGYQALKSAGLLGVLTQAKHCVREAEAVAAH